LLIKVLYGNTPLPTNPPPFKFAIFPDITKQAISMNCQILGYEHEKIVNESILGMFSILSPPKSIACTKIDYVEFLTGVINFQ